jgi:hypothetical protein
MTATKLFLGFSVLLWLPYGLFCTFVPGYLGEVAGVLGESPTGATEIRAMYGGLQAGIGSLCLFALIRPAQIRNALVTLCFLTGGLFVARFIGFLIDQSASGYTYGTLIFESANTLVAFLLLRSGDRETALA